MIWIFTGSTESLVQNGSRSFFRFSLENTLRSAELIHAFIVIRTISLIQKYTAFSKKLLTLIVPRYGRRLRCHRKTSLIFRGHNPHAYVPKRSPLGNDSHYFSIYPGELKKNRNFSTCFRPHSGIGLLPHV